MISAPPPIRAKLGAYQHAAAGHEGQRDDEHPPGRPRPLGLRPADHHPPEQPEVGHHQAAFQAGRGEVARRRHRDVDQRAGRQHDRAPAHQAGSEQPTGAQHQHRQTDQAQSERQRQGHILQLQRPGHSAGEIHQIRPHHRGVGLDPLALVEHRAVARQQVSHSTQHDQPVVGDPAPLPGTPAEQHRDHGHARPEAGPNRDVVRERRPAYRLEHRPARNGAGGSRRPRQPRKTATPTVPIKARNSTCSTRSRSAMSSGSPARPPSTSTA